MLVSSIKISSPRIYTSSLQPASVMMIDREGRQKASYVFNQTSLCDQPRRIVNSGGLMWISCLGGPTAEPCVLQMNVSSGAVITILNLFQCSLPDHLSVTHDHEEVIITCESEVYAYNYSSEFPHPSASVVLNATECLQPYAAIRDPISGWLINIAAC